MTDLTKAVRRRTDATIRAIGKRRLLVVTLYPGDLIGIRPEKARREEITSLESVWGLAVKQRVAKEQAEKRKARKERNKQK